MQLYQHEWKFGKREIVWKHDARSKGGVFSLKFRVFPISTGVDITIYQYGKNVLYLFYNIFYFYFILQSLSHDRFNPRASCSFTGNLLMQY